jgi:hypothetical protein
MNSNAIDRLTAIIIRHDMECVLTRETIHAVIDDMSHADAVVTLLDWAETLVSNSEALLNGEYNN